MQFSSLLILPATENASRASQTPWPSVAPVQFLGGGIDKIEIEVPLEVPFRPEIESILHECRLQRITRRDHQYRCRTDLRGFGYQAMLHEHCVYPRIPHHKIEIFGTGRTSANEWATEIGAIVDTDPVELRVMRVDTAADVVGIGVWWFLTHCAAKHKRNFDIVGTLDHISQPTPFRLTENTKGMTLYLGNKPDRYRIYDKTAHLLRELRQETGKRVTAEAFMEVYGHDPATIVTRVEREMCNRAVPSELATLGDLMRNARYYEPFNSLVLIANGAPVPDESKYPAARYQRGMGIRSLILERGHHAVRQMQNRNGSNNSGTLQKYKEFFPPNPDNASSFKPPDLNAIYQAAASCQTRASQLPQLALAN
jgi:hypothetical protein